MNSGFLSSRMWVGLVALACLLGPLIAIQLPFLTGAQLFIHDSLVASTSLGLFYDRLFSGDSWLWSSSMNAGHPLWMDVELAPIHDPIVMVVYAISAALKSDWQSPYQITAVLWLMVFTLGGMLCTKRFTGNTKAALLVGLLLWGGPLAVVVPGQSWGGLLPFRYLPLAVYFYLRLRGEASTANALYLGTLLAFSLSGYQSVYLFIAFVFLVGADLAVHRGEFLVWSKGILRPGPVLCLGIPLLAILPTLAFLDYSRSLAVMPRIYNEGRVYFFEAQRFLSHLFFLYLEKPYSADMRLIWHGSAFFGIAVLPLLFHGARKALAGSRKQRRWYLVLLVWFAVVSLVSFGALGLQEVAADRGSLFGVRNFGFLLTCQIFILALIAGIGFHEILREGLGPVDVAVNGLVFAVLVGLTAPYADISLRPVALLVAAFVGLSLLLWRLRAAGAGSLVGSIVLILVLAESLALTPAAMLSLGGTAGVVDRMISFEQAAARRPWFQSRRETFVQQRTFEQDLDVHWPFALLAPAVFKTASAYQSPLYINATRTLTTSHFFRLRAYEELMTREADEDLVKEILGVTRPVVELVSPATLGEADGAQLFQLVRNPVDLESGEAAAPGSYRVIGFKGDRLALDVDAPNEVVLVYRDGMAPGWSAEIDGRESEILVVDAVNKAVAVPPGRHEVVFTYRPWPYLVAFALRALVLAAAAIACAWVVTKAARRRHGG